MYLCNSCRKKEGYLHQSMHSSYGKCEICKNVGGCGNYGLQGPKDFDETKTNVKDYVVVKARSIITDMMMIADKLSKLPEKDREEISDCLEKEVDELGLYLKKTLPDIFK